MRICKISTYMIMFFIVGFLSCADRKKETNIVVIDEAVKTKAIHLHEESVFLGNGVELNLSEMFMYARYSFVHHDSILIVVNKSNNEVPYIEFYNLNQQKTIKRCLTRGNGHEEVLEILVEYNNNCLKVYDFMKDAFCYFDVDDYLNASEFPLNVVKTSFSCQAMDMYNDSLFLFENPNCFSDKNIQVVQNEPRFIIGNTQTKEDECKYYTYNVSAGEIVTNPSKKRIVYASNSQPLIEIYDDKLNLLKTLKGPEDLHIEYGVVDNEVIFKKVIPYTYRKNCSNNDAFYLTYHGVKTLEIEKYPTWIIKFDWKGNIQGSYYFDRYISAMSLSEDGKYLYATTVDEVKMPMLVKFKLP